MKKKEERRRKDVGEGREKKESLYEIGRQRGRKEGKGREKGKLEEKGKRGHREEK